jgi:hypothetical protein
MASCTFWPHCAALLLVAWAAAASANKSTAGDSPLPDKPDFPDSFLDSVEQQRRVTIDLVRTEVENALRQARVRLATDPAAVERDLNLLIERVARVPELNSGMRLHLRGALEAAVREGHRRADTKEIVDEQTQQAAAAARDSLRYAASVTRDEEARKQWVARYQSLLDEGRYVEARGISAGAQTVSPDRAIATSAPLVAQAIEGRAASLAIRAARREAFLATFASAEKSANPTPDDQCVIYPDAEAWRALTERRKRYVHVDLKKLSPAEAKIQELLKETTTFDFTHVPLHEVADYLADRYGIAVLLDVKALQNAGIDLDTSVTSKLKGISFRSALRLTLRPMNLAYMMKDEVLMITTPEVADNELVVKVYPVDDLVTPIRPVGGRHRHR